MMAILGWLVMCAIAAGFWLASGFWLFVTVTFKAGETLILVILFALLAMAFSYGVIVHFPFEVALKVAS